VPQHGRVWIDERGSEVLEIPECRRLLAVGVKEGRHGHLGISTDSAPIIIPVDYSLQGIQIAIEIGDGLFEEVADHLVAFQVDGLVMTRGASLWATSGASSCGALLLRWTPRPWRTSLSLGWQSQVADSC